MEQVISRTESTAILALFQTTKEQRAERVAAIVSAVEEGQVNPLEAHLHAKCAEEQIKLLLGNDRFKSIVLEEAQKHGKSFSLHNAAWQVKETGTKYDYAATGDTVLIEMQAQADELAEKIKARQKFLQNIPESGMADPETGAMLYRAPKSSTTIVAVTLK